MDEVLPSGYWPNVFIDENDLTFNLPEFLKWPT